MATNSGFADGRPQRGSSVRTAMLSTQFNKTIQDMRSNQILCDVVLKGMDDAGEGIPCHRSILSAHSSYFRAMFSIGLKECVEDEVRLQNIPISILNTLIDYFYSFELVIDNRNVHEILAAAIFLDVHTLPDTCFEFIEQHLDQANCVKVFRSLHCQTFRPNLCVHAEDLFLQHFVEISHSAEFLDLDKDKVMEVLVSDDLCVDDEDVVLTAIIRWIEHDLPTRRQQSYEILQSIRPLFLRPPSIQRFILAMVNATNDTTLHKHLDESGYLHDLPNSQGDASSGKSRPRILYGRDVIVCAGGVSRECIVRNVDCFDPANLIWTTLKSLPQSVCYAGLVKLL
ncbi:kelch-like protein 2 isoform X2 [Paramacrobiotus metropolitanus]|uniref:kelch-like protein 2 isoform X2 n=1 Tax=Paramacrobiotus metropolitanus TaxID=2943436 RepID=UPI002445FCCB|nr:kelch-like protein 2 isoform X2 [Paramacrobiotus metropolitanus]